MFALCSGIDKSLNLSVFLDLILDASNNHKGLQKEVPDDFAGERGFRKLARPGLQPDGGAYREVFSGVSLQTSVASRIVVYARRSVN
jgi:hypothetical protein